MTFNDINVPKRIGKILLLFVIKVFILLVLFKFCIMELTESICCDGILYAGPTAI